MLRQLRSFLQQWQVSSETCGSAEIAVGEALNNVIQHAYDMGGPIWLRATVESGEVRVEIRDQGALLPFDRLLGHRPLEIPEDAALLPEGGFGWQLINALAESVFYQRLDGENTLCFQFGNKGG